MADKGFASLLAGLQCRKWDEAVMAWKRPSSTNERYFVRLDAHKTCLSMWPVDNPKTITVLDLNRVTDLRTKPFDDEGEGVALDEQEQQRFLSLAYWEDVPDLVNVLLLNLIVDTPSAAVAEEWRAGLRALIKANINNSMRFISPSEQHFRAYAFIRAHADSNDRLSSSTVIRLIGKDSSDLVTPVLQLSGIEGDMHVSQFTYELFTELERQAAPRADLEQEFAKIAGQGRTSIDAALFAKFLAEYQRDPRANEILDPVPTATSVLETIRRFEPDAALAKAGVLSKAAFFAYLLSSENDFHTPAHRQEYQDMTRPLSHYYCASSHNTYLTGDQLKSRSSYEIYRQVLLSGCRCLEIDIWDGPNGDPEVTHGKTLCTKIDFRKVLEAVRDYAFVTSDYPVLLSFENHTSPPQMKKVAAACTEILGPLLLREYLDGLNYKTFIEKKEQLPSPARLKGKILIKNKRRKEDLRPDDPTAAGPGDADEEPEASAALGGPAATARDDDALEAIPGFEDTDLAEEEARRLERISEVVKELSDLVNYLTPYHFKSFRNSEAHLVPCHISSFSETRAARLSATHAEAFVDYNITQLSRIYPKGQRITSSNYNPALYWSVGCQLVALNYQTPGVALEINFGRFFSNARCGYVLKPDVLCNKDKTFNPFGQNALEQVVALDVTVTIISGQHLARADAQPYVECMLAGLPADTTKRFRTRPYRSKGLSPRWNADNTFSFTSLLPDLAVLRIAAYDSSRRNLGWVALPLNSLRPGYRHLTLQNARNRLAQLFVLFKVEIHVPNQHADLIDRITNPTAHSTIAAVNMKTLLMMTDLDEDATTAAKPALAAAPAGAPSPAVFGGAGPGVSAAGAFATLPASSTLQAGSSLPDLGLPRPGAAAAVASPSLGSTTLRAIDSFQDNVTETMRKFVYNTPAGKQLLKELAQLQKKHHKQLEEQHKSHVKDTKKAFLAFETEFKRVHAANYSALKKVVGPGKKSDSSSVEEINQTRRRGHLDLLELEAGFVDAHISSAIAHENQLHSMRLRNHDEIGAVRVAFIDDQHKTAAAYLMKALDAESEISMKEFRKSLKTQALRSDEESKLSAAHNEKLVSKSFTAAQQQKYQQGQDKEKLRLEIEHERTELVQAHAKITAELQKRLADLKQTQTQLRAAQLSSITWDREQPKAMLAALRTQGRLPPV